MHPLEAALEANPDDEATWLVYADHLIEAGDPRGELAAIQRAHASAPSRDLAVAEAQVIRKHGKALLGRFAESPGYTIGWHHGHARSLRVAEPYGSKPPPGIVVAEMLKQPAARFLRDIHIAPYSFPGAVDHNKVPYEYSLRREAKIIDAIAAAPRLALRSLIFGPPEIGATVALDDEGRDALSHLGGDFGKLDRLWPAVSGLERILFSGGWMDLGTPALTELRDFELRQSNLRAVNLASLTAAQMPKLERLSLWCGAYDDHLPDALHEYSPAELKRVLDRCPAIRSLGLVSTMDTRAIAEMVLATKLDLIELDLGGGVLVDADLASLMTHRDRLARLGSLDLRWNLLSPAAREIATGIPNIKLDPQRHERGYVQPRFNACQE